MTTQDMLGNAGKSKATRIRDYEAAGFGQAEIARIVGCRTSYVRAVRYRARDGGRARWETAHLGDRDAARKAVSR